MTHYYIMISTEWFVKNESEKLYDNKVNTNLIKNRYSFLYNNEKILNNIIESIKDIKIINYKAFYEIIELKNELSNIFKDENTIYYYLSVFILESFNVGFIELNKKNLTSEIHNNINSITNNISNLNIFISKKENKTEKNIKNLFEFTIKLIKKLESDKIISYNNFRNKGKTYKNLQIKDFKVSPFVEIYTEEFKILEFNNKVYLMCQIFNSIKSINSVNYQTNDFEIENYNLIKSLTTKKMFIDLDLLSEIFNEYKKKFEIKDENIVETYEKIILNHSNLIKEEDNFAIKESSKTIAIYQKAILFEYIIKNNIQFCFAPIIIDFRGRIYKTSSFSLTFVKELRMCIYLGEYDENFIKDYKENKTDKIINKYVDQLKKIKNYENKIVNKEMVIKRAIIWTLISIGENFKKDLGESVNFKDLLDLGIDIFNNNKIDIEYEKKIKILSYFKTLKMLLNENKIKKRIIEKDATASVYQHLVKILGAKEDFYKKANLDSEDTWYDTYQFIIKDWKEKNKIKIEEIGLKEMDKYFNRKTLKKTLMTRNYGCGLEKSRNYFFEDIEYNKNIREKLGKLFFNFYKFIEKEEAITINNTDNILSYLFEKNFEKIIFNDGSKADLKYYKIDIKRLDTKLDKKRYTITKIIKSELIDYEKMSIAAKANYIHSLDSAIARDIAEKIECFIIHDCFIVGCLEVSILIDLVNKCFNKKYDKGWALTFDKKFYSIFIVI